MAQVKRAKILVADDSATVRETLKELLEQEGFCVITASDGLETIEKTYQESPDLLILDILMPRMKGYQVCRFLKRDSTTSGMPVIMLTVKTEKEDVLWGKDAGAQGYLDKNILRDPAGLLSLVEQIRQLLKGFPHQDIASPAPSPTEALSLVNDMLDEELRKSRFLSQRLNSLFELSQQLFSIVDRDKLCQEIMDVCLKLMDADAGSLMLFDPITNKLKIVASFGIDEKVARRVEVIVGERICGWVAQHKKPLLLNDGLDKYNLFSHLETRNDIESSICVPLLVSDALKGVLNLNRKRSQGNFTNADLEFVMTLANYLASFIEKEKLYHELVQSEKMGALGYFASGMAHEIRNPLATISAEAQYLLDKENVKEPQEPLQIIIAESNRISDIIERLLSFCRPKDKLLQPVSVNIAIEETMKLVNHQMQLDSVQIVKNVPLTLPKVMATPTELEEVFLNFTLNAHQAMPQGGTLNISAETKGNLVAIKFTDTGQGIPEENLKSIFEPFFTTKNKGTGLGLFISQQIIQSLGGWITATSEVGEGATFTIYLPVAKESVS